VEDHDGHKRTQPTPFTTTELYTSPPSSARSQSSQHESRYNANHQLAQASTQNTDRWESSRSRGYSYSSQPHTTPNDSRPPLLATHSYSSVSTSSSSQYVSKPSPTSFSPPPTADSRQYQFPAPLIRHQSDQSNHPPLNTAARPSTSDPSSDLNSNHVFARESPPRRPASSHLPPSLAALAIAGPISRIDDNLDGTPKERVKRGFGSISTHDDFGVGPPMQSTVLGLDLGRPDLLGRRDEMIPRGVHNTGIDKEGEVKREGYGPVPLPRFGELFR
jgi:hypothetical protein